MSHPVLATKLYIPRIRPGFVKRPRLTGCLNEGLHRKITLVSAAAGFGKSTLLSEWVNHCDRPVAWLSLDEGDNDPHRFLRYFIEALKTVEESFGISSLAMLESPQAPPVESTLTSLVNEIAALAENLLLVLDDYHALEAGPVDQAVEFLIEHLPPQLHLVIATREDPPLPLARLRARGQMTELRAADLRFSASEAAEFFHQTMGLELSARDASALEVRTEGWIAGLQMAALSIQGRKDYTGFISAFTGSHRFVLDYLIEEVLQRQSESVRGFLLQTSILDRLNGSLCDALTGQSDGEAMLQVLERTNLFVVPLDDQRVWYRYHHLFGEVLRTRRAPGDRAATDLHGRASEWFEQNHFPADAIHHALAAGDCERAASLLELAWPEMRNDHPETLFLDWLRAIPEQRVNASPVLSVYRGFALLPRDIEAADLCLRQAEHWRDAGAEIAAGGEMGGSGMIVANEAEFRSLPGMIAIARAYHAGAVGDFAGIVQHARRALDRLPEEASVWRGSAAALLGIAHWIKGDLDSASRSIAEATISMRKAGDISGVISTLYLLAELKAVLGRLSEAERVCRKALEVAAEYQGPTPQGTADIRVALSAIHHQRGELDLAEQQLHAARALPGQALLPESRHYWYIVMAQIRQAQGDFSAAGELLAQARELQIDSPAPDVRPVAAWQARLALAQGRLGEALDWTRERGLGANDEPSYLLEFEHLTLAGILIFRARREGSRQDAEQAVSLLARLEAAASRGNRKGCLIDIHLLRALALQAAGKSTEASVPLTSALMIGEPQGYVQLFVDAGEPLTELLRAVAKKNGPAANHARRLLAIVENTSVQPETAQPLVEPLSERERDVLRLLAGDLSGPRIAEQLFISLNTLRTHSKRIYAKLGVKGRRAAVSRAAELGLLSR